MIWTLVVVCVAIFLTYHFWWKRRHLPPGPIPLPIIGNNVQLGLYDCADGFLLDCQRKYGPVFTFWIGEMPVVALCNYDKCVEYFVRKGDKLQDRPDNDAFFHYVRNRVGGIIVESGDLWRQQRRFALHALREFGLGKDLMEERIMDELSRFMNRIEADRDNGIKGIQITKKVDIAVGSLINALMFGYAYSDENLDEFWDLQKRAQRFMTLSGHPITMTCRDRPALFCKLPVFRSYCRSVKDACSHLSHFFSQRIADHADHMRHEDVEHLEPTDLVAAYLKARAKAVRDFGHEQSFTLPQLNTFCFDVWIGGQETTSLTINWGLAYLVHAPEVQSKVHEELDAVIDSDRWEVQRLCNLLPMNVLHATTEEMNVEGYVLPKRTAITPVLTTILHDEKVFPEPRAFKPERFLDENGELKRIDQLIPFSLGKRQCVGEGLAKMEIFLFLANTMNRYKLEADDDLPDLTRHHGITIKVQDYTCRLIRRR